MSATQEQLDAELRKTVALARSAEALEKLRVTPEWKELDAALTQACLRLYSQIAHSCEDVGTLRYLQGSILALELVIGTPDIVVAKARLRASAAKEQTLQGNAALEKIYRDAYGIDSALPKNGVPK